MKLLSILTLTIIFTLLGYMKIFTVNDHLELTGFKKFTTILITSFIISVLTTLLFFGIIR